jgi:hypothetical protein
MKLPNTLDNIAIDAPTLSVYIMNVDSSPAVISPARTSFAPYLTDPMKSCLGPSNTQNKQNDRIVAPN